MILLEKDRCSTKAPPLLPLLYIPPYDQQSVPHWLRLVSKTLQSAVDAQNNAESFVETPGNGGNGGAVTVAAGGREGVAISGDDEKVTGGHNGFGGREFSVELEALRTGIALLTHVPS